MWHVVTGSHTHADAHIIRLSNKKIISMHTLTINKSTVLLDVCLNTTCDYIVTWSHMSARCMHILSNTLELCMYLYANRVYSHSYSALLYKGIQTKMKLVICDDHRNNVLLWLKFDVMTFKSQNDSTCDTPTLSPFHLTHNNTSPFAKWLLIWHSKI